MKLLGWNLVRDENRRVFAHEGELVTFRLDVPTVYAYREPRYGVLWGGRSCDVQAGSGADVERQVVLNRRARDRRQMLLVTLAVRDNLTPTFQQLGASFAALAGVARTANEAAAEFQRAHDAARRAALRRAAEAIR